MLYCATHIINTSNEGEPQEVKAEKADEEAAMPVLKKPAPKPAVKDISPGMRHREIITNQLLELPDDSHNGDNGGKRLTGPFLYPNSGVFYESWFIKVNSYPQVGFRFWKRENQQLVPWDGDTFYIISKTGPAKSFNGFLNFQPSKQGDGPVGMKTVRFSILPADFKQDENPHAKYFLQLGQEYVIDCRGEYGKKIGSDQIKIPETLEKNQVVVFNVIANEYNPPLPKVYTFKGRIEGYEYKKGSDYVATISNGDYCGATYLNRKGEFSFASEHPFPRGLTVYIKGYGGDDPLYAISKPVQGDDVEFPRDAVYLAKEKDLIHVNVVIPPGCFPAEKKGLCYYLTYPDKEVWLKKDKLIMYFDVAKVYENEFDEFKKNRELKFQCLPGEYAIYGGWQIGKAPHRLGTVKVSSSDNGKTLKMSPAK